MSTTPSHRSYQDYLDLFDHKLQRLGHDDILLFPDRAIGPSAEQQLMDLRSNPKFSAHPWPSPGVYNTRRLASKLSKISKSLTPELSKLELIRSWSTLWPDQKLSTIVELWKRIDLLLAHSTDAALWLEISQEATQNNDPELGEWMDALLGAMQWCVYCDQQKVVGSVWHFLNNCAAKISSLNKHDFLIAFERSPWMSGSKLKIHIPLLKSPYPVETAFFRALESHPSLEVIYYGARLNLNETPPCPKLQELGSLSSLERPDLIVPTGNLKSLPYTLLESELAKWTLHIPSIAESNHKKNIYEFKFLEQDISNDDPNFDLLNKLQDLHKSLQSLFTENLKGDDMLAAADFMGLLNLNTAEESTHPNWSAKGISCISLDDTWALPKQKICLATNQEDFESPWNPSSREQRSKNLVPRELSKLLAERQILASDSKEETFWARTFFNERKNDFFVWKSSKAPKAFPLLPYDFAETLNDVKISSKLSPSAIEDLLKCPFMYLDQRLLKNHISPEQNSLTLNALRKGSWLHKSLEDFYTQPTRPQEPFEFICESLEKHLAEYFQDISTDAYLSALKRAVPKFALKLSDYLLKFEGAVDQVWPSRTFKTETSFEEAFEDFVLRGKIDRIDFLENNEAFVWDYKSGNQFNYGLKTLVGANHRKIQWTLYLKVVEAKFGVKVIGGGYLNVLKPKDSGIFFLESKNNLSKVSKLKEHLDDSLYSVKLVKADEEKDVFFEFSSALKEAKNILSTRNFERRPHKPSLCQSCSSKISCGKPFFATEIEGEP